jgi:hypothetical protein
MNLLILAGLLLAANDWTIVPGVRVGPVTESTKPADVAALFPDGGVHDEQLELDEGVLQPATMVYKSNRSQMLAIVWSGEKPKQIFICFGLRRGACKWEAAGGIKFGTRLDELEQKNAKPFTIHGFGYDYGGNVDSWDGGKLESFDCNGRLILTVDGDRNRGEYTVPMTSEERHAVSGDRPISSNLAAMRKLNPGVVGMLFQFPGPESKKCR